MLRKFGHVNETDSMKGKLPERVFTELVRDVAILDCEYGEYRDYMEVGGYNVLLEVPEDVEALRKIVNFDQHPCEWTTTVGKDSGYLASLFVLNDDYCILAFMPASIAPQAILEGLDD